MTTQINHQKRLRIAIVGGGANGVSAFCELQKQLAYRVDSERFEIVLYEKTGTFGKGLAFGTRFESHILNMPVSTMSSVAGDDTHFLRWLRKHPDYLNENDRFKIDDEINGKLVLSSSPGGYLLKVR